jgi:WhiB family redox-sensing transcriptional regulator
VDVTAMLDRPATQFVSPCLADPVRWDIGGDDPALKALCRGCPRRWRCAHEALDTPGIEGMVAGVHVPADGRGRAFALRQLQSLAAHAGYATQPDMP